MEVVQPIRDIEQIRDIKKFLSNWDSRYYLMFMLGIRTGLRITDILELRVSDVRDSNKKLKTHIVIKENKTSKRKRIKVHKELKQLLIEHVEGKLDNEFIIQSNMKDKFGETKPISRQRAWGVLKIAADFVGVDDLGCHSMRKTFGYHYYKKTKDIALLQNIFNHSSSAITLRYIGITDDLLDKAYDNIEY